MVRTRKKQHIFRIVLIVLSALLLLLSAAGCSAASGGKRSNAEQTSQAETGRDRQKVTEDGEYSQKEDVALYLHLFEHLPDNYISKSEAKKLGWVSTKGNLWDVAPGKSIGGDPFGNREGSLPEKRSRKYYECDVNYQGGVRGPERIIYSSDGLIYYTDNHYNSFEKLYGEDE